MCILESKENSLTLLNLLYKMYIKSNDSILGAGGENMDIKLVADSLNSQAYDIIKSKIINEELPSGTRLVASKIADEFGISRTPLRDAIRKLTEEGLVVCSENKGYYVFKPTLKDIEEIFEIRQMIDIAAATKLVKEILPVDEKARARLLDFRKSIENDVGSSKFIKSDEDFHDLLVSLSGNKRLREMYASLRDQTFSFRQITAHDEKRIKRAVDCHRRIFMGIMELNLDMAIEAIIEHIDNSKHDAMKDFSSD